MTDHLQDADQTLRDAFVALAIRVLAQIKHVLAESPDATFTIEVGHGDTYRGGIILYGHDEFPKGSVLEGQARRQWLEDFTSWDEANAVVVEVKKHLPKLDIEVDGGSTFIPAATLCDAAGLHDDDY